MSGKSGSGSGGGKSGGEAILGAPQAAAAEIHPQGLLSAIGMIERAYENERGGAMIPAGRFTTPQRIEFMEVGARTSFASGLVMALLTPLAIGVLDHYIPIFGSLNPSLFDQFCGILLALIFPLSYSFLFANAAMKHLGGYTRSMVNNLLGGMAAASFGKAAIAFLAFHFIYFKILSDKNIAWFVKKLYAFKVSYQSALSIFVWVKDFKQVFITSSYFVVVSTLIFVAVPYAAFWWAGQRNKKLIEAGVANVFNENE